MDVDIQIQSAAEALDRRDGTGTRRLVRPPCLFDQVGGDDTEDDTNTFPMIA